MEREKEIEWETYREENTERETCKQRETHIVTKETGREEESGVGIDTETESQSQIVVEADSQAWDMQSERQRISKPVSTQEYIYLLTSNGTPVICFIIMKELWMG